MAHAAHGRSQADSGRFTNQNGDYASTVRLSEEYATQARAMVDVDEPSIEGLQALLLIHRALFAAGKGRRSFMVLCKSTPDQSLHAIINESSDGDRDGDSYESPPRSFFKGQPYP
jgi:hypothetical protein